MHMFRNCDNKQVDLDDTKTYTYLSKYKTAASLSELAKCNLGKALYYIEFFHPEIFRDSPKLSCGYIQVERIKQYCFWFAQEWNAHLTDTEENRLWFKKFIYMFGDETENMC